MPLKHFLVLATAGRGIRFAALIFVPQLFRPATLGAQSPVSHQPPAITVRGQGPETYVLISGMVGGVAGYRRLEERLLAQGHRVISIDPYQMSIDAREVSFDAMAARVETELTKRGVQRAHIVGHAHGGGVALRLAARSSQIASEVVLLDVGAQASNGGPVFSSTLRLVPLITRLPFGREFVRSRFLEGLRENTGSYEWLDEATKRAYTEPMLRNIDRVIALAMRLAKAEEPEPVEAVISRIHVPVAVVLGQITGPASATPEEMRALQPLGSLLRVSVIAGAGHFPHEELPDAVVRELVASTVRFASNPGGPR